VLVVEDNPGDVRLVEEGVAATDADVELEVCNNGPAAVTLFSDEEYIRTNKLQLVLLDLNVPGKSGHEVLETVRNGNQFDDLPVVVVSSSQNPDDVQRAYENSANAYLTKPADPDEYIRMIAAAIRFWLPAANLPQRND
jgi:CheY-like chemotaxis protein